MTPTYDELRHLSPEGREQYTYLLESGYVSFPQSLFAKDIMLGFSYNSWDKEKAALIYLGRCYNQNKKRSERYQQYEREGVPILDWERTFYNEQKAAKACKERRGEDF